MGVGYEEIVDQGFMQREFPQPSPWNWTTETKCSEYGEGWPRPSDFQTVREYTGVWLTESK